MRSMKKSEAVRRDTERHSARDADALLRKDVMMTEQDAAKYLAVTAKCLQSWRLRGGGPVFLKYSGRCVRYRLSDLNAWLTERMRTSTSDPGMVQEEMSRA